MQRLVVFLAFVLAVSGCVSPTGKLDDSLIAQIKDGSSTEQDVERLLGRPAGKITGSNGKSVVGYRAMKADSQPDRNAVDANGANNSARAYNHYLHLRSLSVLYGRDGKVERHHFYVAEGGYDAQPTQVTLGAKVKPAQLELIVKGVTRRAQMVNWFGQPIGENLNLDGYLVLSWLYVEKGVASRAGQELQVIVSPQGLVLDFQVVQEVGGSPAH